jgi:DNA-binding NarL/FixJ family response regulator
LSAEVLPHLPRARERFGARKGAVRLLLADDQALFRTGLARLLDGDPRVEVVAEAANGQEAIAKAAECQPDVILMDVRMPNMDGIETMQRIKATHPHIRVLFLSSFETSGSVLQALKNGAGGYVLKDSMPEAIITSILAVDAGEQVLSRAVAGQVVELALNGGPPKEKLDGLTNRELEILKLVATGLSNKQIAYRFKISEKTVRNHVSHIYEKVGVVDRSQAAVYAVRKGLIEL